MFLLSFSLSLPFDWTLSICLLFCFVIFWMLCCVMGEKKNTVDNKKKISESGHKTMIISLSIKST